MFNIGALMIRIGFWGILYYSCNKDPLQNNSIGSYYKVFMVGCRGGPE